MVVKEEPAAPAESVSQSSEQMDVTVTSAIKVDTATSSADVEVVAPPKLESPVVAPLDQVTVCYIY